jgi:rRNA maturation endonuclease Nob1
MTDQTDREVVFICQNCGASSTSPRTPINVCQNCGGQIVLRYADRVEDGGTGAVADGDNEDDGR